MGVHDTYCCICGITTTRIHWYKNDIEYLQNIINKGEFHIPSKSKKFSLSLQKKTQKLSPLLIDNYSKYIKDIKKLESKFKWCDEILLITENQVININNLIEGDYGRYYNKNKSYETQKFMWNDDNKSLVCHKSCYNLIYKKFKYKLKLDDIKNKLNNYSLLSNYGPVVNKYIGYQEFPWTSMILNENSRFFTNFESIMIKNKKLKINNLNINFLTNPLKNKKNADRIINIWKPIIKKLQSNTKIIRPSPSNSATLYKVGYKKKGNDGNMYEVIETKNKIKRWKKLK